MNAVIISRVKESKAGLTLIEVMLAIVLLTIGLTVMLASMSNCLTIMKLSQDYQKAQLVLQMGELEHPMVTTKSIDELEVDEEPYEEIFTYSREIEEDDEEEDDLRIVTVTVAWGEGENSSKEQVVRYLYRTEEDK